ncbi:hypothetical protein B0H67DRAFT_583004 [Lasiosphaeris hirsuta]|uniref:Uncharacterized protein n=1 Tax=Lasiosphaeris hirsuta TaxID=260670 RepID=A0AA40AID0_9PEZI|nr:hypothetical protein B0H67DRAFT_583004 [Lasiosphaeris hirsuta]
MCNGRKDHMNLPYSWPNSSHDSNGFVQQRRGDIFETLARSYRPPDIPFFKAHSTSSAV